MTLRRFRPYFSYLRPVRGALVIATIAGLVYSAATGVGLPWMIKTVFPAIFDGPRDLPWRDILVIAAYIPIIFALRGAFGYLNGYCIQLAGTRILESIRVDYFRKLQLLPLSFVQNRQTGDLLSRGLADTTQLQTTLTVLANDGIKQPGTLLFAIGSVGYLAWHAQGVAMLLACLGVVPLTVLPIRYVGRRILKRAEELQAQLGSITGQFAENLAAAREVRDNLERMRRAGAMSGPGEVARLARHRILRALCAGGIGAIVLDLADAGVAGAGGGRSRTHRGDAAGAGRRRSSGDDRRGDLCDHCLSGRQCDLCEWRFDAHDFILPGAGQRRLFVMGRRDLGYEWRKQQRCRPAVLCSGRC